MTAPASDTHAAAPRPMAPTLVVLVLSLMLGLQPITTDLYLPALPALTAGFGATLAQAQLTLGGLLLAFGVSQLVWGPLSDRYGRRPILLWGLGMYVVASVASALATGMEALIAARLVQGAAMGAGVMCARAIVRDLYRPVDGARMMSKGQTGLGVIACLSGPAGGLLAEWLGWRWALLTLGVFGAIALGVVLLRFEETLAQRNPRALQPTTLWTTWRTILSHPTFWTFSTLSSATYAGLFTYLASSSFIFIEVLGLSRLQYGAMMFTVSAVYIAGTVTCRRLLPRWGVRRTVAIAGACTLAGGLLMGGFALAGIRSAWALLLPLYLYMLAHGVHQPCSQSGAIGPFPGAAGAASALNGFIMMVVAFAVGGWLGRAMDGTVMPLVWGVCFWSVVIAVTAWTLVQRHGKPSEH